MKIAANYPKDTGKLYHQVPGDVIQFCHNDGTQDYAYYMVLDSSSPQQETKKVVKLHTGEVFVKSVSLQTIFFNDAILVPAGYAE